MRVAVAYFSNNENPSLRKISESIAAGVRQQGLVAEIIDIRNDRTRSLSGFSYIALGTTADSVWGGRVSPELKKYLSQVGSVLGKKCCAFVSNPGLRRRKTLLDLMTLMESEGMLIKNSLILSTCNEALNLGSRLHIFQE